MSLIHSTIPGFQPNYLPNGAFVLFQKTSPAVSTIVPTLNYGPDMWHFSYSSGQLQVQRFAASADTFNAHTACLIDITAGTSNTYFMQQFLESPIAVSLRGKVVTFSIWIRKTATLNSDVTLTLGARSGEGYSSPVVFSNSVSIPNASITTSWKRFHNTWRIPLNSSILGLSPQFVLDGASSGESVLVTNAMLSLNGNPVPFKPYGGSRETEIAACMRFTEKSFSLDQVPAVSIAAHHHAMRNTTASGASYFHFPFQVEKRVTPVMTFYPPAAGALGSWRIWDNVGSAILPLVISRADGNGVTAYSGINKTLAEGNWVADSNIY